MNQQDIIISKDIFKLPIREKTLQSIVNDMKENGFDSAHPVIIWGVKNILVDGHTRYEAAKQCGIDDIPVLHREFKDADEASEYALVNCQVNRRNLTDNEILKCIQEIDRRRTMSEAGSMKGKKPAPSGAGLGKSSQETAMALGVSPRKVERARTVLDHASSEIKGKVTSNEMSINKAYEETQSTRKEEQLKRTSTFNKTNDNIDWAKWTWNPITGCLLECDYCYAHDIARRFNKSFDPEFHNDRLNAPQNTSLPKGDKPGDRRVFLCSMADMWGDWVPRRWIDLVLDVCRKSPNWTFITLTKNPKRYLNFADVMPDNIWLGATVEKQSRVENTEVVFGKLRGLMDNVLFVSCEPLLEQIEFKDSFSDCINWIVIGGQSRTSKLPEFQPDGEWVKALTNQAWCENVPVYWKPNLKWRPRESPHRPPDAAV